MADTKGLLDVSISSVLDFTPRKAGKGLWSLAKGICSVVSNKRVRDLTKEVEALKAQVGTVHTIS